MLTHTKFDIEAISVSMDAIEYGVVHWFNAEYGFGFITPDAGGPDILVSFSEVGGNGTRVPNGPAGELPGRWDALLATGNGRPPAMTPTRFREAAGR